MILIKIGGGAAINLEGIVKDLPQLGEFFVIVHGANALRDQLAEKLHITKQVITSVSGYSSVFSDNKIIDLMMMTYAGLRNKRLVELCQRYGINAIGLSGIDGRLIQGRRNKGMRIKENNKIKLLHDFSGKPLGVNENLLNLLLENGYIPVITVPITDESGWAINSENDEITALLQSVLHARIVIQFIEAPGFLDNAGDPSSVLLHIHQSELEQKKMQVQGRMKRKILALQKLFEWGPTKVIIADGRIENPLSEALNGKGTVIT